MPSKDFLSANIESFISCWNRQMKPHGMAEVYNDAKRRGEREGFCWGALAMAILLLTIFAVTR